MILALIFVILGLLALLLIVFSAKGQFTTGNLDELAAQLRPVDINAFRNLVAVSEQQYLRDHLPPREFRAIHRQPCWLRRATFVVPRKTPQSLFA